MAKNLLDKDTLTNQQAKYFAYELTRRNKDNNLGRLSQALMDAQVDLNPHQIEAASFALQSPLSKGSILADEVGLGKTIEAGIVLCQYWAERKRHLLVICPASLREQWKTELEEKFSLDAVILERKNYIPKLLSLTDKAIIISYNMAAKIEQDLMTVAWNLVVFDEAHKLRNVYKESNKTGQAISRALKDRKKLLLTATPLQNSLMELYGLSSLIDDNIFGDDRSFRMQYVTSAVGYESLKKRLQCFCRRTLRSNVLEYIRYTQRKPITFPFVPSQDEQKLYEEVAQFLKNENLYAIPPRQRHLISLILYKLLASSSNAIYGTFSTMLERLKKLKAGQQTEQEDEILEDLIAEADMEDEQSPEEIEETVEKEDSSIDMEQLDREIEQIEGYLKLASTIKYDNKTVELLKAIEIGFAEMEKMGAPRKALIFTESRRTQKYLFEYLSSHGYNGKIVQFFGGNKLKRNDLMNEFKNKAEIMIATEAGAEGLNMQFCSLLINYDLPWNPQRVEQRIGRCHRYGQKFDVVVINFVNKKNPADRRVFELLSEKFKLFEGVFGASDEILGSIEDGVDFEKKILNIYQTCRTDKEIEAAFDTLQKEMEESIDKKMRQTKQKLLNEFDASVHQRLKVSLEETKIQLSERQEMFWRLAKTILKDDGDFDDRELSFTLKNKQLGKCQKYYFITQTDKHIDLSNDVILRLSHPLGEKILSAAKSNDTSELDELVFNVTNSPRKHSYLQKMCDERITGWCTCHLLKIKSFEEEEYLVLSGIDNFQNNVDSETLEEMIKLDVASISKERDLLDIEEKNLTKVQNDNIEKTKWLSENRNNAFFQEESDKIDRYTDDKLYAAEKELRDVKSKIKSLQREVRTVENIERKVVLEEEIATLERKQRRLRQNIFDVEDEIELERKELIENLRQHMNAKITQEQLFTFRWKLI